MLRIFAFVAESGTHSRKSSLLCTRYAFRIKPMAGIRYRVSYVFCKRLGP